MRSCLMFFALYHSQGWGLLRQIFTWRRETTADFWLWMQLVSVPQKNIEYQKNAFLKMVLRWCFKEFNSNIKWLRPVSPPRMVIKWHSSPFQSSIIKPWPYSSVPGCLALRQSASCRPRRAPWWVQRICRCDPIKDVGTKMGIKPGKNQICGNKKGD